MEKEMNYLSERIAFISRGLEYADKDSDIAIRGNTELELLNSIQLAIEALSEPVEEVKPYTEQDMDNAYDKGYYDGAHTTSDPH